MTKVTLEDPGMPHKVFCIEGDVLAHLNTYHMKEYTLATSAKSVWSRTVNCREWGEGSIPSRVSALFKLRHSKECPRFSWQDLEAEGLDVEGMVNFLAKLTS